MVSLMSDSRLVFLIWFVGIAIVIAVGLIVIEVRLRRLREKEEAKKKEKTPFDLMKISLANEKDIRKKLDIISDTAKNYFKDKYSLDLKHDYGELAKEFDDRGSNLEKEFCEKMFEAYYSDKKLTGKDIDDFSNRLGEIYKKKEVAVSISVVPGFGDKVDRFFADLVDWVENKFKEKAEAKRERKDSIARVEARVEHELMGWVRKAIDMGYDKIKILDLLNDGKRDKKEIKKVLKIYDDEVLKNGGISSQPHFDGGVAQRIIQREKDRLEEVSI